MPSRKLTLKNASLIDLQQGIAIIDAGYQTTVDGKNVARGFNLTASVRYALARTGIVIKPFIEAWKKANTEVFEAHEPKTVTEEDGSENRQVPADQRAAYEKAVTELLEQEVEIELPELKVADLKIGDGKGENAIPVNALTLLDPILVWPETEA